MCLIGNNALIIPFEAIMAYINTYANTGANLFSSSWSFCCCVLSAAPQESSPLPSERSRLGSEWTSAMRTGTLTGTCSQENKHILIHRWNQIANVEGSDSVCQPVKKPNVFALTSRCSSIHACCTAPVQSHSAGTGSWSSGYDRGSRCQDRLDAAAEAQVSSVSCAELHPPSLPAEHKK